MKKLILSIIIIIPLITFTAHSGNYFGAGVQYLSQLSDAADLNEASLGMTMHYENRSFCQFWYGFRFDYNSLEPLADLEPGTNYYESAMVFSPNVRFNFLGSNCREYNIVPYAQGLLMFSSLDNTDDMSNLGIGAGAGVGVAYSFSLAKLCWMLDLNGIFSAPNVIYRDEDRDVFMSANVSLTLSVRL